MSLDQVTIETVSEAGQLLIRAAAVLGTLSPAQQKALQIETNGNLPDAIAFTLRGARQVSREIDQCLLNHPPMGLVDLTL